MAEKQSLLNFMAEIDEKKKQVFMKTFNEISKHFTQIFRELSPNGDAMLKLENEQSPFDGGLEIIARPEGSGTSYIGSLSGGQMALTALAFIFALQRYRPTTFYVLDEIDAHLDPKNRTRVAEMLRQFSRESQIVVVTLHDAVMSVADRLFGVTKENGISRIYAVELSNVEG
jgi:chromosome segregation protein